MPSQPWPSPASRPAGAAEAGSSVAGETAKLRVSAVPIRFETLYLAKGRGFFAKNGLEVEIVTGADSASQLAWVVSGDVDIATGFWINDAKSVAQGVPVRVIGGNGLVDAEASNSGVIASKDSGITDLAGLKDTAIGVGGVKTGGDIPALQALDGAGIDINDVKEVGIPYAGMQAALEQGTVDAVVPADSFCHQMLDAGFESISNPVREYQGNMPVTVWTVKHDWVAAHGAASEGFLASMCEAVAFCEYPTNLAAVQKVDVMVNRVELAKVPKEFVLADVTLNVKEAQAGIDAMVHFGLLERPWRSMRCWGQRLRGEIRRRPSGLPAPPDQPRGAIDTNLGTNRDFPSPGLLGGALPGAGCSIRDPEGREPVLMCVRS